MSLSQFPNTPQRLIDYWASLPTQAGASCPTRANFSVKGITSFMPEVFIIECAEGDVLRILQIGTKLDRDIGRDLTHKDILKVLPAEHVSGEMAFYRNLCRTPCAGMTTHSLQNTIGWPSLYKAVLLPLLDASGDVRFFVGAGTLLRMEEAVADVALEDMDFGQLPERQYLDIGAGLPI
ncbi:MAG: PAS domain-containing protein [Kordiimonadaceae bacterium]|nr:PAS domain-containing protein [Kordiimonadaceae bacterium]